MTFGGNLFGELVAEFTVAAASEGNVEGGERSGVRDRGQCQDQYGHGFCGVGR